MPEDKHEILRVLCGSRAYGLHNEDSDWDHHGIFVVPTSQLLSIGPKPKQTDWIEGVEDNVSWEVGHFCQLATKGNPTILETLRGPVLESNEWGHLLRALWPAFLSKHYIYNAFLGYSHNQQKKFLDDSLPFERRRKFMVSYLRVLVHGCELLRDGTYETEITHPDIRDLLLQAKAGKLSAGALIDIADSMKELLAGHYVKSSLPEEPDIEKINEFLLDLRRAYW